MVDEDQDTPRGMTARAKRRIWAVVALLLVIGISRFTIFRAFDGVEWRRLGQNDKLRGCNPRQYMYLDLILFHRLKGLSREQVIDLLGKPSPSPDVAGYEMFYSLGVQSLSLNKAYLALSFQDNRVDRYSWVTSLR